MSIAYQGKTSRSSSNFHGSKPGIRRSFNAKHKFGGFKSGSHKTTGGGHGHGNSAGRTHGYGHGGGNRGGYGGRRGRFVGRSYRDLSKFVNKVSVIEEAEVFVPEHDFADFPIDPRLAHTIAAKGYSQPTPIQDRSIPHVLKGDDVVGIANTGTGKTAAFLIPLINKVLKNYQEKILIIVPTRELAIQIRDELTGFTPRLNVYSVCCVGGAAIYPQISALRRSHNFIIGTPGRLKDLIERKCINLSQFSTVVLDEADRMLDMGFIADVKAMMAAMPEKRQTLFFSATVSSEIETLISRFLKNPIKISVKTRDTAKDIDQDIVRLKPGENKLEALKNLLRQPGFGKVLIFGKTKHGVERLSNDLIKSGFAAESIHGNKNHSGRQRVLTKFKSNQIAILVATDVAARGLDIAGVTHVINYDLPATYEDYIHRIGRTGRAGKLGKALTFVE